MEVRVLTGQAVIKAGYDEEKYTKQDCVQSTVDSNASRLTVRSSCCESAENTSVEEGKKLCKRRNQQECVKYECSTCQMFFTRQGEFKRHMVKHSNVRPYKCTVVHM